MASQRPRAWQPNLTWLTRLRERHGGTWAIPDFESFKGIASRHLVGAD